MRLGYPAAVQRRPRCSAIPLLAAGAWLLAAGPLASRHPPDPLRSAFARADPSEWVTVLDPERAAPGYTLDLFQRRIPMLMDLSGRIVHAWPAVRVLGRARLTREGGLYLISTENLVEEYDWGGRLRFRFALPPGHLAHHDLLRLEGGHYLVVARPEDGTDYLLEVDPAGAEVWRWEIADHRAAFPGWDDAARDPTHVNSVQELPPNPWFDAGDARFRPGNLLVSARNLDTIFVVDRESGEVVWRHRQGLDYQHEAHMIPLGQPRAGRILLFNNGYHDRDAYRRSRVQAFHPLTGVRELELTAPLFFSSVAGTTQPLPNGNVLVTSSEGGRIFELAEDGAIVWQLEPPFLPMRATRYPVDHCPQLARLAWRKPDAVVPGAPFVNRELYQFLLPEQPRRQVDGFARLVLDAGRACRELRLPPEATLKLQYGLDPREFLNGRVEARFLVELRQPGSAGAERILDDRMRSEADLGPRDLELPLESYGHRNVELCLDARILDGPPGVNPDRAVAWSEPLIRAGGREASETKITAEEQRLREEQLRLIGYVQ